jgi:hypothetical protein
LRNAKLGRIQIFGGKMTREISPGEKLDNINRRRWLSANHSEIINANRAITDLARTVAYSGSFKVDLIDIQPEDDPYERVGTNFVPLDFSRRVSVRELPRENRDDEIKVGLKIMTGEREPTNPELIATFSAETDSVELNGADGVTAEDLKDLKAILNYINNSPEK